MDAHPATHRTVSAPAFVEPAAAMSGSACHFRCRSRRTRWRQAPPPPAAGTVARCSGCCSYSCFLVVVQAARHALSATDQPGTARHDSARLVPEAGHQPRSHRAGLGSARLGLARGIFGVHTWIAVKPARAPAWQRLEVIGWRLYRGGSAVSITSGVPDAYWYGNRPLLLAELQRRAAADAIPRLLDAARRYPTPIATGSGLVRTATPSSPSSRAGAGAVSGAAGDGDRQGLPGRRPLAGPGPERHRLAADARRPRRSDARRRGAWRSTCSA